MLGRAARNLKMNHEYPKRSNYNIYKTCKIYRIIVRLCILQYSHTQNETMKKKRNTDEKTREEKKNAKSFSFVLKDNFNYIKL